MASFKPYKELSVLKPETDQGVFKLVTSSGHVYAEVHAEEDAYRLVDCWNACRKLYSPEAHITATDEYVLRLEGLRKDLVAQLRETSA